MWMETGDIWIECGWSPRDIRIECGWSPGDIWIEFGMVSLIFFNRSIRSTTRTEGGSKLNNLALFYYWGEKDYCYSSTTSPSSLLLVNRSSQDWGRAVAYWVDSCASDLKVSRSCHNPVCSLSNSSIPCRLVPCCVDSRRRCSWY